MSNSEKKRKILNVPIIEEVTAVNAEEVAPLDVKPEDTEDVTVSNWESDSKKVSKDNQKHNSELLPPVILNNQAPTTHPGNPGQQARFNHVMDNRTCDTSKYFK